MAEDLEKKEDKKETKEKASKTNTAKTSTARKTGTKQNSSSKEVKTTEKKNTKRTTKKSDSKREEKANARLADLTELMEKIEDETEKQVSRTRKTKVQKKSNEPEEIDKPKEKNSTKQKSPRKSSLKQNEENESKELTIKKNAKELIINPEKLEKIEEEIKKQTTISEEKKNKINKVIFHNIAIANIIMLYFIFLILGYQTILPETFMVDLQVFSAITIGIAIIIFEKAYKKDSSEYAIHGIEVLFLAIVTLISTYIYSKNQEKFTCIMLIICYLFAIYYVGKSIVIYLKMKTKALKRVNDIHKIVKK